MHHPRPPRAFWLLSQELAAADISHTAYLTIHNMVRPLASPCALLHVLLANRLSILQRQA